MMLQRTAFSTSRLLDFCSEKELTAQTGHGPRDWPLVVLKELVDNALDACEEAGIAPEIAVHVDDYGITVADNGPGLPAEVIARVLDFNIRVSSREAYIAPDRGAQGNALKTLVAMPYVLDGESGTVEIESHGIRHEITYRVDHIRQCPVIAHHQEPGLVRIGSSVTVRWPVSSSTILMSARERFLQVADDFAWLNPHLAISVDWFGSAGSSDASQPGWQKWRACDPTSPHWYQAQDLERLIAKYLALDEDAGNVRMARDFIAEFRGLKATAKQKSVLEATTLSRAPLSNLRNGQGTDTGRIATLLAAMQEHSAPVKPEQLGVIGRDHLQARFAAAGCKMETFQYKRATGEKNGLPWIIEAAFGYRPDAPRRLVLGINWSSSIGDPFRLGYSASLDSLLERQYAGAGREPWSMSEPVIVFVHLVHPRVEFTDRGKSAIAATTLDVEAFKGVVHAVTEKWAKQRKKEEKNARARSTREEALTRVKSMGVKEAAYSMMKTAYMKASANNTLPAAARQIMYAARGAIQELTGKTLNDAYFTQTLLPDFMAEHPEMTANWRIAWDARGHLIEPHTRHSVPLGTKDVDRYLAGLHEPRWSEPSAEMPAVSTRGPSGCYGALLFIEKEGFAELFNAARLAERYDLAIMSTKGVSVTAARKLVDRICAQYGIPLFVLHDFDVSGFTILRTLKCNTRRYTFKNEIEVIDLGLRLDDVDEGELESESVHHKNDFTAIRAQLEDSGATDTEIQFLMHSRVELNAFTSDKLIEWLEAKLQAHGVQKVVPDEATLAEEYRRSKQSAWLQEQFGELLERSREYADGLEIPDNLRDEVAKRLQDAPTLPWQDVLD